MGEGERVVLRAGSAVAVVDPARGALLSSLRLDGEELLVQAVGTRGPAIPDHGSFLLAPWVGEIAEGNLAFHGRSHELPANVGRHAVHGLVYHGLWDVVSMSDRSIVLQRDLAEPWPFGGRVRQHIDLAESALTLRVEVDAADAGMPVSVGWHPWFRIADPDLVRLRVLADSRLELDDELLPTGRILPVDGDADLRGGPRIADRHINDVYIDVREPITLALRRHRVSIENDPAISTIVIYVSDGAVCVEPWSAWPNAMAMFDRGHPSGIVKVEPGKSLSRWTRWIWSRTKA